ncbi:MAG: hypothetical protein AAGL24_09930 [Pseudomonadota bacterium]
MLTLRNAEPMRRTRALAGLFLRLAAGLLLAAAWLFLGVGERARALQKRIERLIEESDL